MSDVIVAVCKHEETASRGRGSMQEALESVVNARETRQQGTRFVTLAGKN